MDQHRWSLRWIIGGIYFCIMVIILSALAIYFSQRTARDYKETVAWTLRGQAMLGADLLRPVIVELGDVQSAEQENEAQISKVTQDIPGADRLAPARLKQEHDKLEARKAELFTNIKDMLRGIHIRTAARRVVLLDRYGNLMACTPSKGLPITLDSIHLNPDLDAMTLQPEVQQMLRGEEWGNNIRFNPSTNEELLFTAVPVLAKSHRPESPTFGGWTAGTPEPEVIVAKRPIHKLAILVLATPTVEINDTVSRMRGAIVLAFAGALFVLILINIGVSNYISRPLAVLSAAAERFAHGRLTERIVPTDALEIASLGESLNRMAEQLRVTISRLAEERAQAEAILTSMVDGVLVTDTHGHILLINQSAEQILGLTGAAILGRTLPEVIAHADLLELVQKTLATRLPSRQELTFTQPVEQVIEVHVAPVEVEMRPLGIVIVLYDITHQRKLEQVRRDFVANVSHELRTPVTSIRAMSETLADGGVDDAEMTHDFLQTIIGESERLTALLDDLLQLSRIESGHRTMLAEEIDLCQEIRHVAQRVIAPITAKQQTLILELPDTLPMVTDRNAIVQVMVNLLDNAQKYSPEGGVIRVHVRQEQAIIITVEDTGIGIPTGELERIFERFYRVDKARSRAQKGTGLGLAIVKHLLEQLGGHIRVESELGVGSRFTVEFPMVAEETEKSMPEEAGELPAGARTSVRGEK